MSLEIFREFWREWLFGVVAPLVFVFALMLYLATPLGEHHGFVDYWLHRYQALVAGLLGLAGGLSAYIGIRSQIASSERQHWRIVHSPAIDALSAHKNALRKLRETIARAPTRSDIRMLRSILQQTDIRQKMGENDSALREVHEILLVRQRVKAAIDKFDYLQAIVTDSKEEPPGDLLLQKAALIKRLHFVEHGFYVVRQLMRRGESPDQIERKLGWPSHSNAS